MQPEGCWVAWFFFLISLKTKLYDEPGKKYEKELCVKNKQSKIHTHIYWNNKKSITELLQSPLSLLKLVEILLSHEYEAFSKCICW